jgi:hypothetical protein
MSVASGYSAWEPLHPEHGRGGRRGLKRRRFDYNTLWRLKCAAYPFPAYGILALPFPGLLMVGFENLRYPFGFSQRGCCGRVMLWWCVPLHAMQDLSNGSGLVPCRGGASAPAILCPTPNVTATILSIVRECNRWEAPSPPPLPPLTPLPRNIHRSPHHTHISSMRLFVGAGAPPLPGVRGPEQSCWPALLGQRRERAAPGPGRGCTCRPRGQVHRQRLVAVSSGGRVP